MNHTVYGIGIAKTVFQLHTVDMTTGEIVSIKLKREKFLSYFVNLPPCLIGRELIKLGHSVKLLAGKFVKSFVMGNKSDVADAKAIWVAVQQPGVKPIAIKTEQQQAILALHRLRQGLVKTRTMQTNALRGLLTKYGFVMPKGKAGLRRDIATTLESLRLRLPSIVIDALRDQWQRINELDNQITEIEHKLHIWLKQDKAAQNNNRK